jgi:hypothetical protein
MSTEESPRGDADLFGGKGAGYGDFDDIAADVAHIPMAKGQIQHFLGLLKGGNGTILQIPDHGFDLPLLDHIDPNHMKLTIDSLLPILLGGHFLHNDHFVLLGLQIPQLNVERLILAVLEAAHAVQRGELLDGVAVEGEAAAVGEEDDVGTLLF